MQHIDPHPAFLHGAVSVECRDGWIKPWRIPHDLRGLFPPDDGLPERADRPAGVRLRVRTDSPRLGLAVAPWPDPRVFDLVLNEADIAATALLEPNEEELLFDGLPAGEHTADIWLHVGAPIELRALLAEDGARVAPADDERPRWIAYGSSITQCGDAHSPARAWPATAARMRGLNLTCLGFGGNCHMETMVALTIRDLPADVITLKLGINMHGGSYSPRTFTAQVIGFVRILRQRHTDIPIAIVSPIANREGEHTPGATGMDLAMMREHLADAVQRLADHGDPNLHYLDGRELFGEELCETNLPDQVHPDGDGYEIIGRNAARKLLPMLGF